MALFRRFGIINGDNSESEILLNLEHIKSVHKVNDETSIILIDGRVIVSLIEYEHLANEMERI